MGLDYKRLIINPSDIVTALLIIISANDWGVIQKENIYLSYKLFSWFDRYPIVMVDNPAVSRQPTTSKPNNSVGLRVFSQQAWTSDSRWVTIFIHLSALAHRMLIKIPLGLLAFVVWIKVLILCTMFSILPSPFRFSVWGTDFSSNIFNFSTKVFIPSSAPVLLSAPISTSLPPRSNFSVFIFLVKASNLRD